MGKNCIHNPPPVQATAKCLKRVIIPQVERFQRAYTLLFSDSCLAWPGAPMALLAQDHKNLLPGNISTVAKDTISLSATWHMLATVAWGIGEERRYRRFRFTFYFQIILPVCLKTSNRNALS